MKESPNMHKSLLTIFCAIALTSSAYAQKPDAPVVSPYVDALKHVDCAGHKGLTSVCLKNASQFTIASVQCGEYPIPLTTRSGTLLPGWTAAVVDLSEAPRTCRKEGVTATTDEGITLHGRPNAADIYQATEVWFYQAQ